mmetsp:Transcript_33045/g.67517  ORF Transcript_33045/g.67517 Transcript_33045/m.67517 type:complete len:265 (-) Transcript_33045:341-1135(-)
MIMIKPFPLTAVAPAFLNTSRRSIFPAAMSTSSSVNAPGGDQKCDTPAAVIFLHGLGNRAGWSSLRRKLPSLRPNLGKNVHYVFPPAPTIGISVNGGMQMPGWFDLYDWPIGVGVKDDKEGKIKAAIQIEETVEKLEKEMDIPPSRIVVGGFSQGGAVALLTAYHRRTEGKVPFAGCVCLSGWLTLKEDLNVTEEVAKSTPLFWAHGEYDDKVLFEQQAHGVGVLKEHGVKVEERSYPMGHESDYDEIDAMAEFLEKVLFPSSS